MTTYRLLIETGHALLNCPFVDYRKEASDRDLVFSPEMEVDWAKNCLDVHATYS